MRRFVLLAACLRAASERPFWMPEDAGAIVLLGGGARTFSCCFPALVATLAEPLQADLFAFLKTHAADPAALERQLETYPRYVGGRFVTQLDCDDECLLPLVRCRGRFANYLADDRNLGRALGQHKLLEMLGYELRKLETERGRRYAWVVWARPDVVPKAAYPSDLGAIANSSAYHQPCGGDVDMGRVLSRDDAERLLFAGMAAVRRDCGVFGTAACAGKRDLACAPYAREAEDLVRRALPHNRGCLRARPVRACGANGG